MSARIFVLVAVLACGLSLSSVARAYTIGTGFTEGCHERITAGAFREFVGLLEVPVTLPDEDEEDQDWKRVGQFLVRAAGIDRETLTETEFFILHSLLAGVRSPDTAGHSVLNLDRARSLHTDPAPVGQYEHSLRATTDDFEEGNRSAVDGMRAVIAAELTESLLLDDDLIEVSVFFDFYGTVEVDVWAPAYHLGRAAHAVQDSFSHTIRDEADDFHSVLQVLNFAEAVAGTLREDRDGLAHSTVLDSCDAETEAVVAAAQLATQQLFLTAGEARATGTTESIDRFLDDWYGFRPGCHADNEYCGNLHQVEIARASPTGPYLCNAAHGALRPKSLLLLLVLFIAGCRRRR